MKLAVQEGMLPGETAVERFKAAKKYGFDGVEVWGSKLWEREEELTQAMEKSGLPISTICAGYEGVFLDTEKPQRDKAIETYKQIQEVSARLKASGVIMVPIFGGPRLPDLSPFKDAVALETELLTQILDILVKHAEKVEGCVLLEPLNRYETHLINTLEQGIEFCRKVKSPNLRIMADFFHMSIEETDLTQSLTLAGKYIGHVHLADSNRTLPGHGHTDFKEAFAALKKIGYDKYLALECRVVGKAEVSLPECVKHLRKLIK